MLKFSQPELLRALASFYLNLIHKNRRKVDLNLQWVCLCVVLVLGKSEERCGESGEGSFFLSFFRCLGGFVLAKIFEIDYFVPCRCTQHIVCDI